MNLYILLTLLCSFLFAVGAVLCKYGMKSLEGQGHPNVLKLAWFLVRNKTWFLGVILSLCTNAAVLQIQAALDLSIVHSLLTTTYIFTLLLGYLFLNEELSGVQWLGTSTVILGTTAIILIDQPVTGGATNVDNLMWLSGVSLVLISILVVIARNCQSINYEIVYALSAGIAFGNCQVFVKASTNMITDQVGSFSVLSLQSLSEFLHIWPSLALLVFSITGFLCMHISFSQGKVSICVALLVVISRTISTSSGYYVYGEHFSAMKIIGIMVILAGLSVIILSSVKKENAVINTA